MYADRDTLIRQYLYAHGAGSVQQLAELTHASVATIRRDLQRLEEAGVVERTHGGVRVAGTAAVEGAFDAREQHNIAVKRAIAHAATALVKPGLSVFLDAGTTVLQFARCLRMTPMPLAVFTNSLPAAQILVGIPDIRVTMLGGQLRAQNLSAVGPIAEAAIAGLWFDLLFLGASAVQPDGTVSTPDPDEASLNACMLQRATRRCLLADSSKFGLTATYRVAALADVTDLVTDADLPAEWHARMSRDGVTVTLAQPVSPHG
jgi:DeoR family fructose operon transcriptional repressor